MLINKMKKVMLLAIIGFVIGLAAGNIIAMIASYLTEGKVIIFSQALEDKAGNPAMALLVQTLCCGIMGAINFAGVILYDSNRLGLLATAALHLLICLADFYPIAFYCGWIKPVFSDVITWLIIETIAYFIVWLIMFIRYRIKVKHLNELLAESLTAAPAE